MFYIDKVMYGGSYGKDVDTFSSPQQALGVFKARFDKRQRKNYQPSKSCFSNEGSVKYSGSDHTVFEDINVPLPTPYWQAIFKIIKSH
jgi:hypothetical protein